jgi:multidrug efflux system membrane fusion protein
MAISDEKREDLERPTMIPETPVSSPDSTPKRSGLGWLFVLLALAALVGGILYLRHRSPAPATPAPGGGGPPPATVSVTKGRQGDIGVYVNALGLVTPLATVSVRSRVDGQLVKVNYQEGQFVHAGDSLVEIDPGPFQAALAQAQGQLARDNALLENAKLDLSRYQDAYSKNAVPKQQLDTQGATVHQYEGIVQLDQGVLDNAKVQLAYCHITAPVSGRVGLRLVDAGNIVHATDASPLVVITVLQPITVVFSVAEDYLPQIQPQLAKQKKMEVDAYDRAQRHKIASGTLATLDNQIDTTTGTLRLKAVFPNEDEALFPNQFVNARLLVDTHHNVTLVPTPVIQRNAQGAFVYLVQAEQTNQTVLAHPVTVVTTDGNDSEIEGLEAGAEVAADNFNRLTDGAKVTVRSDTGGGPGAASGARKGPPGQGQGQGQGGQRKKGQS